MPRRSQIRCAQNQPQFVPLASWHDNRPKRNNHAAERLMVTARPHARAAVSRRGRWYFAPGDHRRSPHSRPLQPETERKWPPAGGGDKSPLTQPLSSSYSVWHATIFARRVHPPGILTGDALRSSCVPGDYSDRLSSSKWPRTRRQTIKAT